MSIEKLMMKGIARKTAVPVTTSHVYVAGLPTGSCEGGKKVTMNENSTARNPTPPISHMPVFPPGTR